MASSPYSLSRQILQRACRAEEQRPIRVIVARSRSTIDLKRATLADAAPYLDVVEASGHEDLQGLDVVAIPAGQEKHRLFEAAEVRRRSRMLG